MDIQMPDGTIVQGVPEGITKSQLMSRYNNYQSAQTAQPQNNQTNNIDQIKSLSKTLDMSQFNSLNAPGDSFITPPTKAPGFDFITKPFENYITSQRQRGADLANAVAATNSPDQNNTQTPYETAGQFALHNAVGGLFDIPVAGMSMVAKGAYEDLPGGAQNKINNIGQTIAPAVKTTLDKYQELKDKYPRAGRNVQAALETLNLLPFTSNAVREGAGAVLESVAPAVKNVAVDSALAVPRGISTVAQGAFAKSPEARQVVENTLKTASNNIYSALDAKNIALNAGATQKIFDNIRQSLKEGSINGLSSAAHPNTTSTLNDLGKWINSPAGTAAFIPEGGVDTGVNAIKTSGIGQISLKELDSYRRQLAGASYSNPEDIRAAAIVRKSLDNSINPSTSNIIQSDLTNGNIEDMKLLKQAQIRWAQKSRYEDINDILTKTQGDPNKIKSALTQFLNKDKNTIGWPEDELKALKNAAQTGAAEKLFKMFGKFGLDLGTSLTPGNTIGPIVGGWASGGIAPGAAVVAGGTISKQLQKYMARGKAEQLLSVIQKGKIPKEIYNLPPVEAQDIISQIKGQSQ